MLALIMLVSALGSVSIVQAADQKAGENITWSIDGNVLTLNGTGEMYNYGPGNFPKWMANSTAEKIVISPGITSIGDYAFNALMRVTEVSIPATVKTIGTRAFSGCHMLASIHIPASVESIGDYAFSTATDTMDSLVQITVDSNNKYFMVENGMLYSSGKTVLYKMPSYLNMQIVNVPSSVVTIKPQAMLGCSNVKEIYLPDSVSFVGQGAFENCSGLQKVTVNSRQCELGIGAVPDNEGLKLYGHKGTNTELYVQNNACKNIEFVLLGSEECQHIIKTYITPATRTAEGKKVETCTVCNKTITTVIPKIASLAFVKSVLEYNGKTQTPEIVIKDANGNVLKQGTDYTVSLPNSRTNVGRYTANITFKGNYSGTAVLYFNIAPQSTVLNRISVTSTSSFTAQWNKVGTQCNGYQVQFATKSDFSDAKTYTISGNGNTSKTFTGLYKNWKYYVRVRSYANTSFNGSNYTIYGAWSPAKRPWMTTATSKLSFTSQLYNGQAKTPAVTVTDSNGKVLQNGTDYTVTYPAGRTNVGRYAVKVSYKGAYGFLTGQTLYYNIPPQSTTINSVSSVSRGFRLIWNKQQNQTSGYQVQYATKSNFSDAKTLTFNNNAQYIFNVMGMKPGWNYYVRIRTFKHTNFNGSNYTLYSPWSAAKSVKAGK